MHKKQLSRLLLETVAIILLLALAASAARMAFVHYYRAAYPVLYSEQVLEQSSRNALPPSLVYAVIRTESGFNPSARSSVDARGLMQITPTTFEWAQFRMHEEKTLDEDSLFDAAVNIQYGAVILRLLLDEFESVETALCAYHAGWGNVKKWLADPELSPDGKAVARIPFRDTAYYVNRVLSTQQTYERLYHFYSN